MHPETHESARPDNVPASRPEAPSPTLAAILADWQRQGKIDVISLSTVAAELTHGRLSPW